MIHLTEQGYNAGRRLCLSNRYDGERIMHVAYAPLGNPEFRKQCCPACLKACLKAWADEVYDEYDEMPDYIQQLRKEAEIMSPLLKACRPQSRGYILAALCGISAGVLLALFI